MKTSTALTVLCALLAVAAWTAPARADTQEANCEVRKDGDKQKGRSGPCTFSQRQGYIDLDLRNGDTFRLSPSGNANHFRDQKGNKVVRSEAGGNTQEFRWEGGKKVVVTFTGNYGGYGNGYNNGYGKSSEYQRGYDDARRGYYDQNKHNQDYKDGHRAGEQSRGGGYGNGNNGNGSGEYFINRLDNGGIEVVWPKSQCYATFDKHGNVQRYSDGCTGNQRSRSQDIARNQR